MNYLLEELQDPVRDLPAIMRGALLVVTVAYLIANVAYLCVLTPQQIMDSKAIAVDFGQVSYRFNRHVCRLAEGGLRGGGC